MDHTGYMPHGLCYLWQPELLLLHVGADLAIAAAYFTIPILLAVFLVRTPGRGAAWRHIPWLFVAFILCCGLTHVASIYTVWVPDYYTAGAIKLVTALVSIATVVAMIPVLPSTLALPTRVAALESERQRNLDDIRALTARLHRAPVPDDAHGG